jgi:tripartite-type tricarboxylate transporter receptor subunit TctC
MRIRWLQVLGIVLLAASWSTQAAYPDHPIRYVLHVSPGGATDVMAREIATVMQQETKVPVVVENRPGGRGAAEMAEITRAKPDGYTIGAVTSTHLAEFHQTLKRYNVGSVDWIARLVTEPYVFVVPADSPVKSMKDLAAAIKAQAGQMVVAGFVKGSGANIAWEMFMASAHLPGSDVNWVPYNSVGAGVTAILGGHGAATVAYYGLVKDQVATGHLRVIGVVAARRLPELPDVPTVEEQGFDVPVSWSQWRGIVAPKGMPADVRAKLGAAIKKALDSPEMQRYIKTNAIEYDYAGPEEFTRFVKEQDGITEDWLKKLGFIH